MSRMNMANIEGRARVANWVTIFTGFVALAAPLILIAEAIVWIVQRRWPTLGTFFGAPATDSWWRVIEALPLSLIVFVVGSTGFWTALFYWRRQEGMLRRIRTASWRASRAATESASEG